jgi:hypothetical protein
LMDQSGPYIGMSWDILFHTNRMWIAGYNEDTMGYHSGLGPMLW